MPECPLPHPWSRDSAPRPRPPSRPRRPLIPAAHDPDEHRSARSAPRPQPRATPHTTARPKAAPNPSQSVPRMISSAKPIVLITRTNDGRPVSRGLLEDAPHFTTLPPPRPGNPPLAPGDCPPDLFPTDAPFARRSQVAWADPRSQLRTTPPNSGRPAAPRARTPARRLTPQPGPKPPAHRPAPTPK